MRKLIALPIIASFALGGCNAGGAWNRLKADIPIIWADTKLIAQKIDSGLQLAAHEIPAGCKLVGQAERLAKQTVADNVLSPTAVKKTNLAIARADALVNSPACLNPQPDDLVMTSVQIVQTIFAIRNATSSTAGAAISAQRAAAGS